MPCWTSLLETARCQVVNVDKAVQDAAEKFDGEVAFALLLYGLDYAGSVKQAELEGLDFTFLGAYPYT